MEEWLLLFFVSDLIKQSLDLEFKRLDNMISEVSGVYNFIVNSELAQRTAQSHVNIAWL